MFLCARGVVALFPPAASPFFIHCLFVYTRARAASLSSGVRLAPALSFVSAAFPSISLSLSLGLPGNFINSTACDDPFAPLCHSGHSSSSTPSPPTTTNDRTYIQLHFLHPPSTSLRYHLHRITSTRPTTIITNACLPPSPRHHKGVDSGIFLLSLPSPPLF